MSIKVYQVIIRAVVVTTEPDPVCWGFEALTDHLAATPQLITEVTSELLVPEVKAPPVAAPIVNKATTYTKSRISRTRRDSTELEYYYRSHDYVSFGKRLKVGTRTTRDKRPCVWLTQDEARLICLAVKKHRVDRGGE